jgi:hypothetical protein
VVDLCYAGVGVTGVATVLRADWIRTTAGVIGVGVGSVIWMTLLAGGVSLVRYSLSRRGFQIADAISGLSMLALAAFMLVRTLA